jgi:formylglycine-generating enzyme required for sulfatase activity
MQAPMTIKQYASQMRTIPGGRFTMGRTYQVKDESELFKDELPAHSVDISTFQMGATLVTVGMWLEYVRVNEQLSMPNVPKWDWIDDHPVVNISWNDIVGVDGTGGYCAWASRMSGVRLTLPTEAQWEYASKGGKLNRTYPWGNSWDETKLWSSVRTAMKSTAPVIRSKNVCENPYGLADMAGNTLQWCSDMYGEYSSQKRD